ncbi:MAG: DUF192 domain-containing protein [Chloroflexota bacterium]
MTARRLIPVLVALVVVVVACGALSLGGADPDASAPSPSTPPTPTPTVPRVVFPSITVNVEVAQTDAERARGLGGHAPLGEPEGMLFVFERPGFHAFWMRGMTFPIDILWIEDGQVVHLEQRLPPPAPDATDAALPIYTPTTAARYVLEVNAGFAEQHGIAVGTAAQIEGL